MRRCSMREGYTEGRRWRTGEWQAIIGNNLLDSNKMGNKDNFILPIDEGDGDTVATNDEGKLVKKKERKAWWKI